MSVAVDDVRAGLDRVLDRVADAGGNPGSLTVVAVTKGFGADAPTAALQAGLVELGESYAQELRGKADAVAGPDLPTPRWHFIGRLQSNKVRLVADRVACWQSLDRASVVDEVADRAPGARVLIQVNAADEDGKGGAAVEATPELVARARDVGLDVVGLMAVGVAGDEPATEAAFAATSALADRLGLRERSFGMSADLAAAVRSGTTMIRVGTALFGPRPSRPGSRSTRSDLRD